MAAVSQLMGSGKHLPQQAQQWSARFEPTTQKIKIERNRSLNMIFKYFKTDLMSNVDIVGLFYTDRSVVNANDNHAGPQRQIKNNDLFLIRGN